jgi:hypothetical protein
MTEAEWLSARTVIGLDLWRTAKERHRKWRLFAAACCQRGIELVGDGRLNAVLEVAELFADSGVTWEEVKIARKVVTAIRKELGDPFGPTESLRHTLEGLECATTKKPVGALGASHKVHFAFRALARGSGIPSEFNRLGDREEAEQVRLAHDIFGNPFRPVAFDPAWRSSAAAGIAQKMYDAREFGAMPILADALQDAGCEDAAILGHCRDPQQAHVLGCWVVDLVLGKQ